MKKGPIFIGGCGSSGTTLLRKILNAHPNIAIGPEMSVFDRSALYEKPFSYLQTAVLTDNYSLFETGQWYVPVFNANGSTYFGLAPGNHGPKYYNKYEIVKGTIGKFDNARDFFDSYFGSWAYLEKGANRWGEKSPNNVFFISEILEMFPDAVFISMVRDPRDVVASMLSRRPEGVDPYLREAATVYRWNMAANAIYSLYFDKKFVSRFYCLTYENLVSDPEFWIRDILEELIGEDYDPRVLEYWRNEDGDGKFDEAGAQYAVSPITDKQVGRYKNFDDQIAMKRVELATADLRGRLVYD